MNAASLSPSPPQACFRTTNLGLSERGPIRIGVLNDMSGPYADCGGSGSVLAAQMGVEDCGGKLAGRKVEVLLAITRAGWMWGWGSSVMDR